MYECPSNIGFILSLIPDCMCGLIDSNPYHMTLPIDETDSTHQIDNVSTFLYHKIQDYEKCNMDILLHDTHGKSRCCAVITNIIMMTEKMNYRNAYMKVKAVYPEAYIQYYLREYLNKKDIVYDNKNIEKAISRQL